MIREQSNRLESLAESCIHLYTPHLKINRFFSAQDFRNEAIGAEDSHPKKVMQSQSILAKLNTF